MILVTGSTGFVGQAVMRALEYRGQDVIGYKGRINNPHTLREQLEGVETVIHLASAERGGRARSLRHVDVEGTERLLEEAERIGTNHVIYISRIGADSNSLFPVLRAKGQAERLMRQSRVPATVIRSSTLFGRGDRFLTPMISLAVWNWPFVWLPAGGQSILQPLWVEDLVRCILAVADPLDLKGYRGQTLLAAGEERLHYEEIVHAVIQTAQLSRRPVPIRMQWVRLVTRLFFGWRRRPPITLFYLDRLAQPEIADLDVVYRSFGFHPARLQQKISFLRQPRLRWHIFGR